MAIRVNTDPKTGETFFEVYINLRSKIDPSLRIQRRKKCKTRKEAKLNERKLTRICYENLIKKEEQGSAWRKVILFWKAKAEQDGRFQNPLNGKSLAPKTINDTVNILFNWTDLWLDIPSAELNRAHGKSVLDRASQKGLSTGSIRKLKLAINSVYQFGIEQELIKGVNKSPVEGLYIDFADNDKIPEILTADEVKKLLFEAKRQNHPWYPVWILAIATGMRSSELYALRKENVLLEERLIRIVESWDFSIGESKSTKAKYWRNSPIASSIVDEIKGWMKTSSPYLLPRFPEWDGGEQAMVLRNFCERIGLPSVRFHTLRACFATHMIASGVDSATVMKIGGWKSFKTFQIYIRLAGIQESGATDRMVGDLLERTNH